MQIVLVSFDLFRCNLLVKCALQTKIAKITKNPYFRSSWSFKVIDVDKPKRHVTSACYDEQMYVPI